MSYSTIMFSEASRKLQEKAGSRMSYQRLEDKERTETLTEAEADFISTRDSFYMATVGDQGYPYIQFRGGPKGFLKVLDEKRLGFIDFKGNLQYISAGNLATNKKVSIILMDYPARVRLKLIAEAEVIELKDNPDLFNTLNLTDYKFRPERMIVLHVKGYNWNCPQHITPRYSREELDEIFESQQKHIKQLEDEIKALKVKLNAGI